MGMEMETSAAVRDGHAGCRPLSRDSLRRAAALHADGKVVEAEAVLRAAIARDPDNSGLRNARGVMLAAMGRPFDALCCYREAIDLDPLGAGIWTNLGNALTRLKYFKTAVMAHQHAIALAKSADALLWRNLGTTLAEAGRHDEAIVAFSRALAIDPGHQMAKWDRGRSYLALGDYVRGWPDYEARRFTGQLPVKKLPGEVWAGQSYVGKRLLLAVEQGFGDTLWAARYLPAVKALGGELLMECQKELIPLIETMGVADRLVPRGEALPEADYHGYLCSLPGLFTPDIAAIPPTPFLGAPGDRMARFVPLFLQANGRLKVGIVWSGSVTFQRNHERAQPLRRFVQGFALPGVQLYSLQKGTPEKQLRVLPRGGPIIDLSPLIDDFADTAAAVAGLDLVIMTDSAVAHLAGAMGRPVWVLLGHGSVHWLWRQGRVDCPWYPSLRLFRPRGEGDWDYVFDCASAALSALAVR